MQRSDLEGFNYGNLTGLGEYPEGRLQGKEDKCLSWPLCRTHAIARPSTGVNGDSLGFSDSTDHKGRHENFCKENK